MAQKKYTIKRTLKLENNDGNMDLSITSTTWHKYGADPICQVVDQSGMQCQTELTDEMLKELLEYTCIKSFFVSKY